MMYKLIALDMDGTLLNSDKAISEENKQAIAKAREAGVTVVLASGRPLEGMQDKLDELNSKLNSMIGNQQSLLSGELVDVNSMISAAQGDSAALQELLQAQLNNVVEQQKNKLFDKLKGKLGQGE